MSDEDQTRTHHHGDSGTGLQPYHPRKIGKYHIKRVIASGGMGTVFEGVQENPRRSVAIKVIKGGEVSEKAVSRLKYEAQMLARLRHPGIAEIYEAGTFKEHGMDVPYFAMEYIPNAKTLIEYANYRRLSVEERLRLFLQVCDAVNSGHQKGVVHRDLKPDNILVDSYSRVRVIDFGLARATDSDLRQTHVQTEVGQIVGSLSYMSPEQFEADSNDLDTRSDVYSLGMVLYELLARRLPYDLKGKKLFEIATTVREQEPRPLGKSGVKVAAEIDVILQKCLRKEREMRYQTAYGLHQDICRYLAGDAIVARSPSLTYQIRVFTRKNKLLVASFAAALGLLVAGVIVSTTLLVQVSRERERAVLESEKAQKAHNFLSSVFETAIPDGFGDQVPISRLLEQSTKMLDGAFPDDPEVEADLRYSLGSGYFNLSHYEEARENLNRSLALRKESLGITHPKTRETLEQLNWLNTVTGDFRNFLGNCQELCRIDSLSHGAVSENTLSSGLQVVKALERLGQIPEALELARKTKVFCLREHPDNAKLLCDVDWYLSWLLMQNGSIDEAEKLARENYERTTAGVEDGAYAGQARSVLAATLISQGRLEEVVDLYGRFPTYPGLDKEYDLIANTNADESDLQLIVFWEEWCPFCDRLMDRVERLYRKYHDAGIDVIGVTNLWQKSSKRDAEYFLWQHEVTFPCIKERGKAADHFNVRGVPSIRLVYKGNLIWDRDVPTIEPLSKHMLDGIVNSRTQPAIY